MKAPAAILGDAAQQLLVIAVADSEGRGQHPAHPEFPGMCAEFIRVDDALIGVAVAEKNDAGRHPRVSFRNPGRAVDPGEPSAGKTGHVPRPKPGNLAADPDRVVLGYRHRIEVDLHVGGEGDQGEAVLLGQAFGEPERGLLGGLELAAPH